MAIDFIKSNSPIEQESILVVSNDYDFITTFRNFTKAAYDLITTDNIVDADKRIKEKKLCLIAARKT